jgi:hypothetical protein
MAILKDPSGIAIDWESRTVVFMGKDMIDLLFNIPSMSNLQTCACATQLVEAAALAIVRSYRPGYVDNQEGRPWSFGCVNESDIPYLESKLPASWETVKLLSGGV